MSFRASNSACIAFGLVSIPVKVYKPYEDKGFSFNMIAPSGGRVKMPYIDSVTGDQVERNACKKGYEVSKGNMVIFDDEELKAVEPESTKTMEIMEFVDLNSIDAVAIKDTCYLGPDKGGDRGYGLLAEILQSTKKVAVAKWTSYGRENLVILRSYQGGLVLHKLYYAAEVRDFSEIEVAKFQFHEAEKSLANQLVSSLDSGPFKPEKYEDEHSKRLAALVEAKAAGKELLQPPSTAKPTVLDLLDALKASLKKTEK